MSTYRHFHPGEVALQAESGIDTDAFDRGVEEAFRPELSDNEVRFVASLTFAVATSIDAAGRPWVSPMLATGEPLFEVEDRTTVRIRPGAPAGDPLATNVAATGELGVLYLDPSRRRRAKSLGRATIDGDGSIVYRMHRNFGLCTKYIFKRSHIAAPTVAREIADAEPARTALDEIDRAQLQASDTIFLGSHHDVHGADATHRGGPAGFVTVLDDTTLLIPDYVGNGMFNTLGNLRLDDRIALMSLDFGSGRALHVTGRGEVVASSPDDAMSERSLRITIDEVRISTASTGEWTDLEPFDHRPGMINPATPMATSTASHG